MKATHILALLLAMPWLSRSLPATTATQRQKLPHRTQQGMCAFDHACRRYKDIPHHQLCQLICRYNKRRLAFTREPFQTVEKAIRPQGTKEKTKKSNCTYNKTSTRRNQRGFIDVKTINCSLAVYYYISNDLKSSHGYNSDDILQP